MQFTHISCIVHQHLLLSLTQENAVTCTAWLESLSTHKDVRGKICKILSKTWVSILARPSLHLLPFVRRFAYNNHKFKYMRSYNHIQHYGKNCIVSHALNTSELRSYVFLMQHTSYWSQGRDIQTSPKQTTAKVNCKHFSHSTSNKWK
jgi:hypothetical protein